MARSPVQGSEGTSQKHNTPGCPEWRFRGLKSIMIYDGRRSVRPIVWKILIWYDTSKKFDMSSLKYFGETGKILSQISTKTTIPEAAAANEFRSGCQFLQALRLVLQAQIRIHPERSLAGSGIVNLPH